MNKIFKSMSITMSVLNFRKISTAILMLGLVFFGTTSITAQEYKAENPGWLVNLDEAYDISKKSGKPILANFTGSDWCGWCKRLTASVFVHDEFKSWADKNVVLLELDYPRRRTLPDDVKEQNAGLQQAFSVRGYPTIWVFDMEKDDKTNQYSIEALGKTGYTKTVTEFTTNIEKMIAKRS